MAMTRRVETAKPLSSPAFSMPIVPPRPPPPRRAIRASRRPEARRERRERRDSRPFLDRRDRAAELRLVDGNPGFGGPGILIRRHRGVDLGVEPSADPLLVLDQHLTQPL